MGRRPIVINNVQINYDKLADAIVKAQRKAKELEEQNECSNMQIDYNSITDAIVEANNRVNNTNQTEINGEKLGFWKAVWYILKGGKSNDGRFLTAPFIVIINVTYIVLAFLSFLFSIIGILGFGAYYWINIASWEQSNIASNVFSIIIMICIMGVLLVFCIVFKGAANDIKHEKNKNYVFGVFSGLISVISLIIAIIALYRA